MDKLMRLFYRILLFLYILKTGRAKEAVKCPVPCIALSKCSTATELLKNGTIPEICHFVELEPYVCCQSNNLIFKIDEQDQRISEKKCQEFYPPIVFPEGTYGAVFAFETEPDEFPFMAVVGYGNFSNPVYNCGGFLAERNVVITAAHCAKYNGEPPTAVLIGGNPLSDSSSKPIRVIKVITHPKYQSDTELNDIAILILGQMADQTPACISDLGDKIYDFEKEVIAAGYGSTSFGGAFARRLLKVFLTLVDNDLCKKVYVGKPIEDTQFCVVGMPRQISATEFGIQDTCQGDSGGPLMLKYGVQITPRIIGIVSYGRGCGTEAPGIYTKIGPYIDWIESVIWSGNSGEEKQYVS